MEDESAWETLAKILAEMLGDYRAVGKRIVSRERSGRYVSSADWQRLHDLNGRMDEIVAILTKSRERTGAPEGKKDSGAPD